MRLLVKRYVVLLLGLRRGGSGGAWGWRFVSALFTVVVHDVLGGEFSGRLDAERAIALACLALMGLDSARFIVEPDALAEVLKLPLAKRVVGEHEPVADFSIRSVRSVDKEREFQHFGPAVL